MLLEEAAFAHDDAEREAKRRQSAKSASPTPGSTLDLRGASSKKIMDTFSGLTGRGMAVQQRSGRPIA